MVLQRILGRFFPVLILMLIFQACAQTKSGPPPEVTSRETPQATTQTVPQTEATARAACPVKPPLTATGDYQKTIDFYRKERRHRPHDQALAKEYVKSLKEIKAAADRASQSEDFVNAGKTYHVLLKNYPQFKGLASELSFDKAQLNTKLTNCKTVLSRKGFEEYRKGNLSEAISLWQGYLAIDPNNADIKKALHTAKTQQKNLQETKQQSAGR